MITPVLKERQEIDVLRWNKAIAMADNGNIYANTGILDLFAPQWSALILGDYELVMPLTWRKKFGVKYLYEPPFLQQLGIFGQAAKNNTTLFLQTARKHFPFAEIFLNHGNDSEGLMPRQNFIIDLNHNDLSAAYAGVHQKNLKRASHAGLEYRSSQHFAHAIDMSHTLYGRQSGLTKKDYDKLKDLAIAMPRHVIVREVWQQQECQASCFCLKDERRIYFLLSAVTSDGRKNQANHFLVDQLIREHAGHPMILDFEGSDIPGVAAFYEGFGAVDEPYYFCKWNHLPWPYRLFKK